MIEQLLTSPDGQWILHRRDRELALAHAPEGPRVALIELPSDDVDIAVVGPPTVLLVVARERARGRVVLYQLPELDPVGQLDLEGPMRLLAMSGLRAMLLSQTGTRVAVVRVQGRAVGAHAIDPGGVVELATGLDGSQALFVVGKKLEVWDLASSRPVMRMQLQLPPAPRILGSAAGHLWAAQLGSEEVFIYRRSDGRPFRHYVGAKVRGVISHPSSQVIVIATPRGLARLHCYAHTAHALDTPWTPPEGDREVGALAQLVNGDDAALIGIAPDQTIGAAPWRLAIAGAGVSTAPATVAAAASPEPAASTVPTATSERDAEPAASPSASPRVEVDPPDRSRSGHDRADRGGGGDRSEAARGPTRARIWRDSLATYGHELARGGDPEPPMVAGGELDALADRLELSTASRRVLLALYAAYLVGAPDLPIAQIAKIAGEWTDALGTGTLAEHALDRRKRGRIALRSVAANFLDGAPPKAVGLAGEPRPVSSLGGDRPALPGRAYQLARSGFPGDRELVDALVRKVGRLAIVMDTLPRALLEAHLHRATVLALTPLPAPPIRWPRGVALVVATDKESTGWTLGLPTVP